MAQVIISGEIRIMQISRGTGPVLMGQKQSNEPGFGGTALSHTVGAAQMLFKNDVVVVPGTDGSVTLANFLTALQQMASDFAAASGTTLITTADLAQINAWSTGSP